MWLFAPWTSSRLQPEPVGSDGESASRSMPSDCEAELSVHVNGKLVRRPRSWRGWRSRKAPAFLFGMMRKPSSVDGSEDWNRWMSSAQDTPVRDFRTPADAVGQAIRDTFGRRAVASLQDSSPASCFWKMSKDISAWVQAKSCGIAEGWAIALRADCIARRKSARRTCESGCSSSAWQTPRSPPADNFTNRSGDRKDELLLGGQAKQWATPNVPTRGCEKAMDKRPESGGEDTQTQATNWPTTSCQDASQRMYQYANGDHAKPVECLPGTARNFSRPTKPTTDDGLSLLQKVWTRPSHPRLSPAFQWWLMGQCPTPIFSALEAIACARFRLRGPLLTSSRASWSLWWQTNVQALCSLCQDDETTIGAML